MRCFAEEWVVCKGEQDGSCCRCGPVMSWLDVLVSGERMLQGALSPAQTVCVFVSVCMG